MFFNHFIRTSNTGQVNNQDSYLYSIFEVKSMKYHKKEGTMINKSYNKNKFQKSQSHQGQASLTDF
jgi:hypothetical protein